MVAEVRRFFLTFRWSYQIYNKSLYVLKKRYRNEEEKSKYNIYVPVIDCSLLSNTYEVYEQNIKRKWLKITDNVLF